jgi:hypothetical protein
VPGLQADLHVETARIAVGSRLHLAVTELDVAIPTLEAMIAPIGGLHATPAMPDGIASVPPVAVRMRGEAPPGDVQLPEETGVPVMNRAYIATLTGAVEIACRLEMITRPTIAALVATTEVVQAVIPVEPADMMSGVNACRLVALSRRYGRLQGVEQPMSAIAPDPAVM